MTPKPWWRPFRSRREQEHPEQQSYPRLGKLDRVALHIFEQIHTRVIDSDDVDDLLEDLVVETAPADFDPEDEEAFDKLHDRTHAAVMARVGRALINNYTDVPDRVAQAAWKNSTERPMQT